MTEIDVRFICWSWSLNSNLCQFIKSDSFLLLSQTTGMMGYEFSKTDKHLVYILTLGVIKSYRRLGIGTWYILLSLSDIQFFQSVDNLALYIFFVAASSLIQKVLKYASDKPSCRAVYLHVISYNSGAIDFYENNSFQCLQRLQNFYHINGHQYDAYLYIYYVNGGRSPCLAL